MDKLDEGLDVLLKSGKEKGFLTYDQVNDHLPDDDTNPEKIDQILILLEAEGIELIEESEAEERESSSTTTVVEDDPRADLDLSFMDEEESRRIDDPVRMYLTQMGEIPLLKRDQEIALAKKIEVTPQAVSPQSSRMRWGPMPSSRHSPARPLGRSAFRSHGQSLADREPRKGQNPPAHAA